jgi:hypothetical protein
LKRFNKGAGGHVKVKLQLLALQLIAHNMRV